MGQRLQKIAMAYASTGAAKIVGALVQFAVLPIAARALGADAFGLIFAVAALASIALVPVAGFSPAASVLMTRAQNDRNVDSIGDVFWSLLFWSAGFGIGLMLLSTIVLFLFNPLNLLGVGVTSAAYGMFPAILLCIFVNSLSGSADGARAAMQESHISGIFAILGSIATICGVLLAVHLDARPVWIFLTIYILPVTAQCANLLAFAIAHRKALGRVRLTLGNGRAIRDILTANVQAQGGMVLYIQGTVYLVSQFAGLSATASLGAFVRIASLIHSMTASFFNPVLPMIGKAMAAGDFNWMRRGLRTLLVIAMTILVIQSAALIFAGTWISTALLDVPVDEDPTFFVALAFFLACYSLTHLMFLTRLSAFPETKKGSKILVAAALGIAIGYLGSANSVASFLFIQALAMALVAMLPYAHELVRLAATPKQI